MHQVYVDIIVDAIIEQYQTMKSCKKLRICLRIMSGC